MIKTALTACVLVAVCRGACAQGAVTFRNDVQFASLADRLVRDNSGTPLVGTNFLAQLYYGPSDAVESSLTPVTSPPARFRADTTPIPGTWVGGNRTLWGFLAGAIVTLQVRVWDGNVAATYEEAHGWGAVGTQHGVSEMFSYWIPPLGGDPRSYIENFRGFTLVPEPSAIALAILGVTGLVFLKRRK